MCLILQFRLNEWLSALQGIVGRLYKRLLTSGTSSPSRRQFPRGPVLARQELISVGVRLAGFGSAIRDLEVGGGDEAFQFDVQLERALAGGTVVPPLALPDRRVVCGLTMISPRNPDPRMIAPGQQPPPATPSNDRMLPGAPKAPDQPGPSPRGTMRTIQPTICWDPAPVAK